MDMDRADIILSKSLQGVFFKELAIEFNISAPYAGELAGKAAMALCDKFMSDTKDLESVVLLPFYRFEVRQIAPRRQHKDWLVRLLKYKYGELDLSALLAYVRANEPDSTKENLATVHQVLWEPEEHPYTAVAKIAQWRQMSVDQLTYMTHVICGRLSPSLYKSLFKDDKNGYGDMDLLRQNREAFFQNTQFELAEKAMEKYDEVLVESLKGKSFTDLAKEYQTTAQTMSNYASRAAIGLFMFLRDILRDHDGPVLLPFDLVGMKNFEYRRAFKEWLMTILDLKYKIITRDELVMRFRALEPTPTENNLKIVRELLKPSKEHMTTALKRIAHKYAHDQDAVAYLAHLFCLRANPELYRQVMKEFQSDDGWKNLTVLRNHGFGFFKPTDFATSNQEPEMAKKTAVQEEPKTNAPKVIKVFEILDIDELVKVFSRMFHHTRLTFYRDDTLGDGEARLVAPFLRQTTDAGPHCHSSSVPPLGNELLAMLDQDLVLSAPSLYDLIEFRFMVNKTTGDYLAKTPECVLIKEWLEELMRRYTSVEATVLMLENQFGGKKEPAWYSQHDTLSLQQQFFTKFPGAVILLKAQEALASGQIYLSKQVVFHTPVEKETMDYSRVKFAWPASPHLPSCSMVFVFEASVPTLEEMKKSVNLKIWADCFDTLLRLQPAVTKEVPYQTSQAREPDQSSPMWVLKERMRMNKLNTIAATVLSSLTLRDCQLQTGNVGQGYGGMFTQDRQARWAQAPMGQQMNPLSTAVPLTPAQVDELEQHLEAMLDILSHPK